MVRAGFHAGLMETTMSSSSSKNEEDKLTSSRELTADELTAAELDSVNGGRGSLLGAVAMSVVDAVAEGVVFPLIRAGVV
jgi:hypothetical protein